MRRRIINFLSELGPFSAGFQVAISIIGFFGIGGIAKWITENWFPFTRWAWENLFNFFNLPALTAPEKDALTSLAFFLPMGIASLAVAFSKSERAAVSASMVQRAIAALVGVFVLYVMSGSILELALDTMNQAEAEAQVSRGRNILIAAFAITVSAIGVMVIFSAKRLSSDAKPELVIDIEEKMARFYFKIRRIIRVTAPIMSMVGVIAALIDVLNPLLDLGMIVNGSLLIVVGSLIITVLLDPPRLIKTAGVISAILLASVVWDVGVFTVQFIESVPSQR
jgi:hypothetical protein